MGSQNFPLKKFSHEVDLGGVRTESLNFGGSTDGIGRKWGGSASGARRAPISYTPPLWMFMTPSLTVVLAKMKAIIPTSWNDFFLQNGTMRPNVGVPKTIPFDEKLLADDYKIIQENLKTWIAYIENVVVQGHIEFQVKVIESDEPLQCTLG